MPTPVDSARQCLAGDAASALDAAVSVARRRVHAQTTSLHVVFALLSTSAATSPTSAEKATSTSSLLRDALSRARSSAYSPRLQFKALELCFSVALDRLPSTSSTSGSADDPPVSNSLMAAVKRSQASQRRHPDTFHFYQQQMMMSSSPASPSTSSFSGVKVELQQLVLAILDDPVVSRVFADAGFSSQDIKLAVLRPPPPILRFPRAARCPPFFLCNFSAAPADEVSIGNDEYCRRIGEILARTTARNPMLVGVGAADAAGDFAAALEQHKQDVLPVEITGLRYVGIEGRVSDARLEELGRRAEKPGVVIGIGDLKGLMELGVEVVNSLVSEMSRVLDLCRGRIWVMGWSANYEIYMKFLSRFPMLDRDWDLHLLPITSQKAGVGGGLLGRPQSLMESFVPFGGFFTTTYEPPSPITKSHPLSPRCHNCNDQYEQELSAILKDRSPPLEDQNQTNLPSWLQKVDMNISPNAPKAKDDRKLLDARVVNLQKKWNDRCQQLHHALLKLETNRHSVLPPVNCLPFISEDKERVINQKGQHPAVSQSQSGSSSALPMAVGLRKISAPSLSISLPMVSEPIDKDLISKFQAGVSKSKQLPASYLGTQDDRTSPSSVTSVTTDLVLGTPREPCIAEKTALSRYNECLNDNEFQQQISSGPKGCPSSCQRINTSDFKSFYTGLLEKVGRQQEAICAISQSIIDCRSGNGRRRGASRKGDIWLSFHGPDRFGKKRIASFLAELVLGSREKLICIDLGYQESFVRTNTICDRQEVNQFDVEFRVKTVSDRITAEITKKPISVVFLENIEEADTRVQNSLLQAVRTGKIPDSHGRELSIHNAIFIVSSKTLRGKIPSPRKEGIRFSEEMILSAQGWQMKILLEPNLDTMCRSPTSNVSISSMQESWNPKIVSKRKMDISDHQAAQSEYLGMKRVHKLPISLLDLNLPVEVVEEDTDCSSTDVGDREKWAEEILNLMDETVNFKPFDFDALADSVLKQISRRLRDTIPRECSMEIDVKVMQQILASTWLLEDKRDLDNWLNEVLFQSFIELRQRFSNKLFCRTVLRLVSFEEALKDEYAPGMLLPSRIILD